MANALHVSSGEFGLYGVGGLTKDIDNFSITDVTNFNKHNAVNGRSN